MKQITQWNNRAVHLLATNRCSDAERLLYSAMSCLNQYSRTRHNDFSTNGNEKMNIKLSSVQAVRIGENDPRLDDPHNAWPVYNFAFVFSCKTEEPEAGAALLYNLGLVHQKRRDLEKAIKLYQLSLQILRDQQDDQEAQVDELLVMAVLYNLGHAYGQLFQTEKVSTCFRFLRQVLYDSNIDFDVDNHLDSEEHSFFLNFLLFENEQMTLAPAA